MHEVMSLYGDQPTKLKNAIDVDWMHVILSAATDINEALRLTAPELAVQRKRMLRRKLALLAVAAEEFEKRINLI